MQILPHRAPHVCGARFEYDELVDAVFADPAAFTATYDNQPVTISGTVDSKAIDIPGRQTVTIDESDQSGTLQVSCVFAQNDDEFYSAFAAGQRITMQGTLHYGS